MKKYEIRKLALSKETVTLLVGAKLEAAQGGAWSDDSVCPTTAPSERRPCG